MRGTVGPWPLRQLTPVPAKSSAPSTSSPTTNSRTVWSGPQPLPGADRLTPHADRSRWLHAAADILDKRTDELAALMTLEMGKTKKASAAEIGKCSAVLRYYADEAPGLIADEPADASAVKASKAYTRYLPLGVVLAVMPWNFPLWQAMRFAAPALAAGNVGLLKHASNVPQTALFMEDAVPGRGLPRRRVPDAAHRQRQGGRGHP